MSLCSILVSLKSLIVRYCHRIITKFEQNIIYKSNNIGSFVSSNTVIYTYYVSRMGVKVHIHIKIEQSLNIWLEADSVGKTLTNCTSSSIFHLSLEIPVIGTLSSSDSQLKEIKCIVTISKHKQIAWFIGRGLSINCPLIKTTLDKIENIIHLNSLCVKCLSKSVCTNSPLQHLKQRT